MSGFNKKIDAINCVEDKIYKATREIFVNISRLV